MSETVQGSETPPTSEAAGESSQTQLARDLEVYEYWDAGTYGAWSEAKRGAAEVREDRGCARRLNPRATKPFRCLTVQGVRLPFGSRRVAN